MTPLLLHTSPPLHRLPQASKDSLQELGSHFIDQGIGILCQGIGVYSELFKRSGLQDREALELAISKTPKGVKEAALELLKIENELAAAGCDVVVVTFGKLSGAERWLRETKCPFPYYSEPSCSLYQLLGLKRSIEPVWNTVTLGYYGAQVAKGISLPQAYTDIKDDPHQMGGDFILDKHSQVQFIYRSKVPSDRPSVDLILSALRETN